MRALGPVVAIVIVVLLLVSGTLYTVDQRQNAIVFQLGEIKEIVNKPGLHFKWPLLQNVRSFDMRILTYDDAEPLRFLTQGNRPVLVDSFVKWHIIDVRQYYVSVQGDEFRAQTRIRQTVSGTLRDEFGIRTVHEVVSGEREQIMARVREKVDQDLKRIGVGVIDVRLKRVDLPQEVSESVYRRMEADPPAAGRERVGLPPHGSRAQAHRQRAALDRRRRGREDPRRRRPPARGDPRRGLPRRAARARRGRRQVGGDLRRGVLAEPGILRLLPQHGGV